MYDGMLKVGKGILRDFYTRTPSCECQNPVFGCINWKQLLLGLEGQWCKISTRTHCSNFWMQKGCNTLYTCFFWIRSLIHMRLNMCQQFFDPYFIPLGRAMWKWGRVWSGSALSSTCMSTASDTSGYIVLPSNFFSHYHTFILNYLLLRCKHCDFCDMLLD